MIVAIDGYSSTGKSTLAKELAIKLNALYIDSGAMYRAVTLYVLEKGLDVSAESICPVLDEIILEFKWNGEELQNQIWMNGVNVERDIRNLQVAQQVSQVAAIRCVRDFLIDLQRSYAVSDDVVMDGRDIGTVIFPDADVKIFVKADYDTRVNRRYQELIARGDDVSKEKVQENLNKRDHIDSTREIAPLKQAKDAYVLDNTHLSKEEQLEKALAIVSEKKH